MKKLYAVICLFCASILIGAPISDTQQLDGQTRNALNLTLGASGSAASIQTPWVGNVDPAGFFLTNSTASFSIFSTNGLAINEQVSQMLNNGMGIDAIGTRSAFRATAAGVAGAKIELGSSRQRWMLGSDISTLTPNPEFEMGNDHGSMFASIYVGNTHTFKLGYPSGNAMEFGTVTGAAVTSTHTPQMTLTNGMLKMAVPINVGAQMVTNAANVHNPVVLINHGYSFVTAGSNLSWFATATHENGGGWGQNTAATNDTFVTKMTVKAGSRTFISRGTSDTSRGIITWTAVTSDGTQTNTWTQDYYAAVLTVNTLKTNTVVLPLDDTYTVQGKMSSKNASSTDFYAILNSYGFIN